MVQGPSFMVHSVLKLPGEGLAGLKPLTLCLWDTGLGVGTSLHEAREKMATGTTEVPMVALELSEVSARVPRAPRTQAYGM